MQQREGRPVSIRRATRRRSVGIPVPLLNDSRLSYKAKGLAAFLLAKPDAWRIDARALAHVGPDGRDAVLSGLTELREAGYLITRRRQGDGGRWWTESILYESPEDAEDPNADICADLVDKAVEPVDNSPTGVGFSGSGSPDPGSPGRNPPTRERKTPNPTGSAAGAPDVVHDGSHPSCRACGTNPRARARPLDPAEAVVAAGAAIVELNDRRRRGDVCPSCEGSGWVLDEANLAHPCPPCQEARALP